MAVLDEVLKKYKVNNTTKELTDLPQKHKGHKTEFRASGNFLDNSTHQMDLLFLPEDKSKGKTVGYKYLLVVTDVGSGKTDARALRYKKAKDVLNCVQAIYKSSKYIQEPTSIIQVDKGSEFNDVKKFYTKKGLSFRTARTARHNQQAVVESINKMIGSTINKLQLQNQLAGEGVDEDGEVREWLVYLPDILEAINKRKMKKMRKPVDDVLCREDTSECEVYKIGDEVRVMLDYPKSFQGNKLHGSFRSGDIRWSLKPHIIENVLLMKNRPIRYVVSGVNDTTYSKFELKPYKEVMKSQPLKKKYEIEDLMWYVTLYPQKSRKGKKAWFVKWKGYNSDQNMLQFEEDLRKELTAEDFKKLAKGKKSRKLTQKQVEEFSKDTRGSSD